MSVKSISPRCESFGKFTGSLRQYVRTKNVRIWVIVDEVVLFETFPIHLPHEQDLGPYNWIVTGSAGIGSWTTKRHLEVFDLPLFDRDECIDFASRLGHHLDINLENAIGVPLDGIDDWLEEKFGGIIGYIAELLLEISRGNAVSQYITALSGRMKTIFT